MIDSALDPTRGMRTMLDVLDYAKEHPTCELQVCIDDGTPNGWRPSPQHTLIEEISGSVTGEITVRFTQTIADARMKERLLFVPLSRIAWASIIKPAPITFQEIA